MTKVSKLNPFSVKTASMRISRDFVKTIISNYFVFFPLKTNGGKKTFSINRHSARECILIATKLY